MDGAIHRLEYKGALFVLGHWMVDHIANLPSSYRLVEPLPQNHVNCEVLTRVGGSGFHFCRAALEAGFTNVTAPIPLGNDDEATFLIDEVERLGVTHFSQTFDCKTDQTLLLYDRSDKRFSCGARTSNEKLSEVLASGIAPPKGAVVYLSTHCLLHSENKDDVLSFVRRSRDNKGVIVIDLVPHNFSSVFNHETIKEIVSLADGLIGTTEAIQAVTDLSRSESKSVNDCVSEILDLVNWVCLQPSEYEMIVGSNIAGAKTIKQQATSFEQKSVKAGALDDDVANALLDFVVALTEQGTE